MDVPLPGGISASDDVEPLAGVELTRHRSAGLFVEFHDDTAPQATRDAARDALVHLHLPLVEHCA
ncbi:MAG: hypothetical protein WC642_02865, partial [Nocardioides sp.]